MSDISRQFRRTLIAVTALTAAAARVAGADAPIATRPTTGPTGSAPSTMPARPNLIFLLADDLRWDAMSCAKNPILRTPNIDRLAAGGVRFRHAFCTTSICAVSRASFATGQYERRHGIHDFATPLSVAAFADTFPARLRRAGYYTGFVGKWGLGGALPTQEFDYWDGFPGQGRYFEPNDPTHLTVRQARSAVTFLERIPSDRPFLLYVSFKAPHAQDSDPRQFLPDPRYDGLFRDVTIPAAPSATAEAFEALPEFLRTSEGRTRWERRFATPEMHQRSVKDYYRLVVGIDEAVGRLQEVLDARHLTANTVMVYTSDNGFFLGEHGLAGKWFMYDESIRLPLVIFDPRLPQARRGATVDGVALNIDIAPTLLDLAGVAAPASMQGRSLVPLVRGQTPSDWRQVWFYEHHFDYKGRIPRSEGVGTDRWKYIRYIDAQPPYEELFDLHTDPYEQHNLAGDKDHVAKLDELRRQWEALGRQAR